MNDQLSLKSLSSPVFIIGPSHSGKTELVSKLIDNEKTVTLIATAQLGSGITQARLDEVKTFRNSDWNVVEVQRDLPAVLSEYLDKYQQVVVDSLNQWIAAEIVNQAATSALDLPEEFKLMVEELCSIIRQTKQKALFITSTEVGACPSSPNPTERQYRKAIGYTNLRIAAAMKTVLTCNAGIPQIIKSPETPVLG